ncbi:MAG: peptidase M42 [Pseudomonadota bacterium]
MPTETPWTQPMPDAQFELMRDIIGAPSPVGFEGAMTLGVLQPQFDRFMPAGWAMHQFVGNAGVVWDSHPGRDDLFSVMICGHADKIRLQVRKIGADGKIWINSDSFLPCTLLGHEAVLFSEDPEAPGSYRRIRGGTIEALGAIHFSEAAHRTGERGIKPTQLYLELQLHGADRKKQVEALGVRVGDVLLLDRPIKPGFAPDTFYGAYLDNGLGCFVTAEVARVVAEAGGTENVRCLYACASHEEIGRFGSRVLAGELRPDALIAVDVDHDFDAAPNIGDRNMQPLKMGGGFTLSTGAIVSEQLNRRIQDTARTHGIPFQMDVAGRDTGTDGMAGVLASVDCAATSIGFPIRNMHTISESGHTGDVLAAIHVIANTLLALDGETDLADGFRRGHARLDQATALAHHSLTDD